MLNQINEYLNRNNEEYNRRLRVSGDVGVARFLYFLLTLLACLGVFSFDLAFS